MYADAKPYGLPEKWNEETDIIVVGTGLAGLSAAIEAAETGLKVLILEKMPYIGGNSSIAGGGYCCWDSKLKMRERLGLGEDSWQLHYEDTLRGGAYYGNPHLIEILVREAPAGLNWLAESGVEFAESLPRIGGHSAHRSYQEKGGSGRNMVNALRARAEALGVAIRFDTAVSGIYRANAGSPVSGTGVKLADGRTVNIRAKSALILASGGFGHDARLREFYRPALAKTLGCNNHKGATGEMIKYAETIGAASVQMEFIQLYPCASVSGGMDRFAFDCYSGPGYGLIYVASDGKRFVNELGGRDEVSNAQLNGIEKPSWSVLNDAVFKKLATPPILIDKAVKRGRVIRADSIKALAEAAGIPADSLENTVSVHNSYLTTGIDPDFGKPISNSMIPITGEVFYAISQWPTIHYCMGGLKINDRAAVIDVWGNEIQGLFAAGEVTGGIHGANRLGGNALADCVVFGRRAGKSAAAYKIPQIKENYLK
jgi:fumarate reductase flavoprotein subunit